MAQVASRRRCRLRLCLLSLAWLSVAPAAAQQPTPPDPYGGLRFYPNQCATDAVFAAIGCYAWTTSAADCACFLTKSVEPYYSQSALAGCCLPQLSGWDGGGGTPTPGVAATPVPTLATGPVLYSECVPVLSLRDVCLRRQQAQQRPTCAVDFLAVPPSFLPPPPANQAGAPILSGTPCLAGGVLRRGESCTLQHRANVCNVTASCVDAASAGASAAGWRTFLGACDQGECFFDDIVAGGRPSVTTPCKKGALIPSGAHCAFQCDRFDPFTNRTVSVGVGTMCNHSVWTPVDVCALTPAPSFAPVVINSTVYTLPPGDFDPVLAQRCLGRVCPLRACMSQQCNFATGECDAVLPDGTPCGQSLANGDVQDQRCVSGTCALPALAGGGSAAAKKKSSNKDDWVRTTALGIGALLLVMCCVVGGFWRRRHLDEHKHLVHSDQHDGRLTLLDGAAVPNPSGGGGVALRRRKDIDYTPTAAPWEKKRAAAEAAAAAAAAAEAEEAVPPKAAHAAFEEVVLPTAGGDSGCIVATRGTEQRPEGLYLVGVVPHSNADRCGLERQIGNMIVHVNGRTDVDSEARFADEIRRARGRDTLVGFGAPHAITQFGLAPDAVVEVRSTGEVGKVVSSLGNGSTVLLKGRGVQYIPLRDLRLVAGTSAEQAPVVAEGEGGGGLSPVPTASAAAAPTNPSLFPPALPSTVSFPYTANQVSNPLQLAGNNYLMGVKLGSGLDKVLSRYYGRQIAMVNGVPVETKQDVTREVEAARAVGVGGVLNPRAGAPHEVSLTFADEQRIDESGQSMPMEGFLDKYGEQHYLKFWADAGRPHLTLATQADSLVQAAQRSRVSIDPAPVSYRGSSYYASPDATPLHQAAAAPAAAGLVDYQHPSDSPVVSYHSSTFLPPAGVTPLAGPAPPRLSRGRGSLTQLPLVARRTPSFSASPPPMPPPIPPMPPSMVGHPDPSLEHGYDRGSTGGGSGYGGALDGPGTPPSLSGHHRPFYQ
eukprot:Rhum_TRINITY_DN9442_c0_g1::Rhum_TRINITY_DN9442_c0_g1_i1::g.33254::m.33254